MTDGSGILFPRARGNWRGVSRLRWRVVLNTSPLLEVIGRLERVDGVTHVRAVQLRRLEVPAEMPQGHDYW